MKPLGDLSNNAHGRISLAVELKDTLKLAAPIVLVQVGHMSMGLVDTLVAARISTDAIAGLGLASSFFWTFTAVCIGFLLSLDTFFSQAAGAGDKDRLQTFLKQSYWSCVLVIVASAIGVLLGALIYRALTSASPVRTSFLEYIMVVSASLPSIFFFFVLQRYWQARHRVAAFTVIIFLANILNLFGNLAFGLGEWGFPRWEVKGLAVSTVICRYFMLGAAIAFTLWQLPRDTFKFPKLDWLVQRSIFKLGWPAAGHTALEIGAFTIATFLVGVLGSVPLAAHQVVLTMASFTFMFPLGFSSAAAVRVGRFVGAGQPEHARLAGWLCIGMSVATMLCFACVYLIFPRTLMHLFTQDPAVVRIGVPILFAVALFQVCDGTQVSATGALRGIGNTQIPMLANLVGHYPIGLTLGVVLCFALNRGVLGMWWGLAAGLLSVATIVLFMWRKLTRDVSTLRPMR